MKTRCSNLIILVLFVVFSSPLLGQKAAIQAGDLSRLIGDWQGSLTYLNYQDNQYVTIRTNLQIVAGEDEDEIKVTNSYPDEPNAGGSYRLWTKKNGTRLNKEKVTSRQVLEDGTIEIVTTYKGRDDNKRATIRITYRIGETNYSSRKDVQYKGETEWIKRNEFSYERS